MKKTGVKVLWEDEWQIEGDLVLKEGKMYVLKDRELRAKNNPVTLWYTSSRTWG